MKDFSHDYIDYGNMAKQLIPDMNTVQHWSKIIETKYERVYKESKLALSRDSALSM